MKLFAGYDSGGSKTVCVLADERGRLLGTGRGGPSNYLYCGKERAKESMETSTREAFEKAGLPLTPMEAAYVGSAAIRMNNGAAHIPFFRTCIEAGTVLCESDILPIWYGALRERPTVISIAGTGAITYVCRPERFTRVSGWGPLLGDEGSGYDLGRRALQTACRIFDGREAPDDVFAREIFSFMGAEDPRDLLLLLNQGDIRSKTATAARPVFRLYETGNATAGRLLEQAAEEIALAISAALKAEEGGESLPVVLSGSLLRPEEALFSLVEKKARALGCPVSDFLSPQVHPAAAAAALALCGGGCAGAAETLLQNAKGALL